MKPALADVRLRERNATIRRTSFFLSFAGKLMLPHTQHTPTCTAQRARYQSVTGLIAYNLRFPITLIALRHPTVFWAAMPEAAVHEHSQPSSFSMNQAKKEFLSLITPPARLGINETAWMLGFSEHDIPVLLSAGLLKPLAALRPPAQSISRLWNCKRCGMTRVG